MELLTRNNFESWMRKLMERLDRQDELLLSLQPSGKAPNPMERIRMFDNQDLCMLLQISKRTLQRYRSIGALPYKTLGKKTYYSEEDVLTFLSGHVKDFKKAVDFRLSVAAFAAQHYIADAMLVTHTLEGAGTHIQQVRRLTGGEQPVCGFFLSFAGNGTHVCRYLGYLFRQCGESGTFHRYYFHIQSFLLVSAAKFGNKQKGL